MEIGIILIHYLIHEVQCHVVDMGGNRNNQRGNYSVTSEKRP